MALFVNVREDAGVCVRCAGHINHKFFIKHPLPIGPIGLIGLMLNHIHQSARVLLIGGLLIASVTYFVTRTGSLHVNWLDKYALTLEPDRTGKSVLTFHVDIDETKLKDVQINVQGNLVVRNNDWVSNQGTGPAHYSTSSFLAMLPRNIDAGGTTFDYDQGNKVLVVTLPTSGTEHVKQETQSGLHASSMTVKNEVDKYIVTVKLDIGDTKLDDLNINVHDQDLTIEGTKIVQTRYINPSFPSESHYSVPFSQPLLMLPRDIEPSETTYEYDDDNDVMVVTLPKLAQGWAIPG